MDNSHIDLGFNNELIDACTYVDYSTKQNPETTRPSNNLTVMQLNIRGILSKQDKLKALINDVKSTGMVTCYNACGNMVE